MMVVAVQTLAAQLFERFERRGKLGMIRHITTRSHCTDRAILDSAPGQHVDVELLVHCPPRTRMRVRSHVIPAGSGNPGWGAHDAESPATWMPALRFREGRLFAGMTIIHPGRTLNIYLSTVTLLHRGAWLGGGP